MEEPAYDPLDEMQHDAGARDHAVWKGAVAGLAGGLAASWVMSRLSGFVMPSEKDDEDSRTDVRAASEEESGDDESSTVKVADAIAEAVTGHQVPDAAKDTAGSAVHYAYGTLLGGVYGAAAEARPGVTRGLGVSFGTAAWALGDELGVPLFGLSKPPTQVPLAKHAGALGLHLVYGLTTEVVRRGVRAML